MGIGEIVFFVLGTVAICSAFTVILHPHPVYSALALVVTLFQIAGLFILLDAQTVAFLQVIVYAGAIMVLFLFVIMLLNLNREAEPASRAWRFGILSVGGALAVEFTWFFLRRLAPSAERGAPDPSYGSISALARTMFTEHTLSFELTSVLLLIAVVGAVVLAKRGSR